MVSPGFHWLKNYADENFNSYRYYYACLCWTWQWRSTWCWAQCCKWPSSTRASIHGLRDQTDYGYSSACLCGTGLDFQAYTGEKHAVARETVGACRWTHDSRLVCLWVHATQWTLHWKRGQRYSSSFSWLPRLRIPQRSVCVHCRHQTLPLLGSLSPDGRPTCSQTVRSSLSAPNASMCGCVISVRRPTSAQTITSPLLASNVPLRGIVIPAQTVSSARSGSMLALNASVPRKYSSSQGLRVPRRSHVSSPLASTIAFFGWLSATEVDRYRAHRSGVVEARVCENVAQNNGTRPAKSRDTINSAIGWSCYNTFDGDHIPQCRAFQGRWLFSSATHMIKTGMMSEEEMQVLCDGEDRLRTLSATRGSAERAVTDAWKSLAVPQELCLLTWLKTDRLCLLHFTLSFPHLCHSSERWQLKVLRHVLDHRFGRVIDDQPNQPYSMTMESCDERKEVMEFKYDRGWTYHGMSAYAWKIWEGCASPWCNTPLCGCAPGWILGGFDIVQVDMCRTKNK